MQRKGFPESYDRRALLRFVRRVKSGGAEVAAPVVLPPDLRHRARTSAVVVRRPDVLIVEGLNVLQPARARTTAAAAWRCQRLLRLHRSTSTPTPRTSARWYVERFLRLRETAFADPDSYFRRYAVLTDEQAVATAARIWDEINGPNLVENILPTRSRATLVLVKGPDHSVQKVRLRKL